MVEYDTIGSAGSLVAAGLATAGQYIQSRLLDHMEAGFVNRVGFLLYLVSAISSLITYAFFGKAPQAIWLLVGPPIVFFLLFMRVESGGTAWQRGDKVFDRRFVSDTIVGIYTPRSTGLPLTSLTAAPIRVSLFFAKWDQIASGISQSFVRFLNLIDPKADALFLTRTERFMELFDAGIPDPDLALFYQSALFPKCLDWIGVQQALQHPAEIVSAGVLQSRLDTLSKVIVIGPADSEFDMIRNLHSRGAFGSAAAIPPGGLNCPELWTLGVAAGRRMASSYVAEKTLTDLPQDVATDTMLKEVAAKFGKPGSTPAQDQASMMNAVTARMLQRGMRSVALSLVGNKSGQYQTSITGSVNPYAESDQNLTAKFQVYTKIHEYRGKGEFLTYMLGLPYVQGLGYFFLSLSFPFFVLFMLVPSRMGSIVLWLQLWAWLKAWDFGFAVVMILDDLLFYLLPRGPAITDDQMLKDPGMAFKAILSADPTYTADLYYNILATSLAAIPIFTGLMVRRGGSEFQHILINGTNTFAGRIGGSLSSFAGSQYGQRVLGASEREKVDAALDARGEFFGDEQMRTAAGFAGLGGMFKGSGSGVTGAVSGAMSDEVKRYGTKWMTARANAMTSFATFQNSLSESQIQKGQMLARTGFALHDLSDAMPISESILGMVVPNDIRYLGAGDRAVQAAAKFTSRGGVRALTGAVGGTAMVGAVQVVGDGSDLPRTPTPIIDRDR